VNITDIEKIITDSDVFAIGFRLFQERLLIDPRFVEGEEATLPMVAIVDPVETLEERYFWFGQHRPSVGLPKDFKFFFWPHSVRYLDESGVWRRICDRIVRSGFRGARETCDDALQDLLHRERRATIEAIEGAGYKTLWAAQLA
jgi:hypothetical protein